MRRLSTFLLVIMLLAAVAIPAVAQPPTTTEELLSGMVTEEVEPGVYRVVNDGVRDPTLRVRGYPGATVDVSPDGDVWLSGDEGRQGLFRLGEEQVHEDRVVFYREVAPDGSLWGIGDASDSESGIYSFAGDGWTLRATTTDDDLPLQALAVGPDGTVWLTALDFDKRCPDTESGDCAGTVLRRLEDDGSVTTIGDWAEVYDGHVAYDEVTVAPDGDVWLIGTERLGSPEAEALLRLDGEEWRVIPGPEGFLNHYAGRSMAFGPDGTLWVNTNLPEDDWQERGSDWRVGGLARFDDPGWTTFTEADGVQDWGGQGFIATDLLSVAPDGSLWMNGIDDISGCDGVDHYDGTTWTSYLRKTCVHDLAIAPDGSVWVRADVEAGSWNATAWDVGLYVITPEALEPPLVEDPSDAEETRTTAEVLLAGMVTEEVEPGVFRVLNDGVRDLVNLDSGTPNAWLVTGSDGSVWVFDSGAGGVTGYRLGQEQTLDWDDLEFHPWDFEVAPDGTLWGARTSDDGAWGRSAVASFDGRSWADRLVLGERTYVRAIAIAPDDTAWALVSDQSACPDDFVGTCARPFVARSGEAGSSVADGWGEVYEGWLGWHRPVVDPDGDVWLVGAADRDSYDPDAFLRYDGTDWHVVDAPEGLSVAVMGESFAFAPDGTLWAAVALAAADQHSPNDGLARLDESGWTIFTEADGVRPWGGQFWLATDYLRVAPDGTAWVNAVVGEMGCDGVASFDGTTWTPYLSGHCVDDFDIASDGGVWVLASADHDDPVHLYVITSEAVAATE